MANSFTYYLRDEILDDVFGGSNYTVPATLYIGLSTTTINADGTGATEPSGNGYSRVSVSNDLTTWSAASNGQKQNAIEILFPEATGAWGTITDFFIADASTGGNILAASALTTSRTINSGDTARFQVGALDIILE